VPADGCGDPVPKHCRTHEGEFWGRSHCNERGCPRCFERWASLEAQNASLRISWGAKFWQDRRATVLERKNAYAPLDLHWLSKRLLVGHFVVSVPSNLGLWVHLWSPTKALAMVYEICRRHRVCGGVVVFHPWRRDDDLKEYVPDGYWHFHIVGVHLMPTTPGGSDIGPDGRVVVFKHIRDDEYGNFGGLRSGRAIARVLQYQLTHAGLQDGRHALTYFGLLHFSKVSQEKIELEYPECLTDGSWTNPKAPSLCPACGSDDVEACYETDFTQIPSLVVPTIYKPDNPQLAHLQVHPEPEYESTPELVDKAETDLEEKFQNLYDAEPDATARHALTKERQRERGKLAQDELELFNMRNPLVEIWVWLKSVLSEGSVDRALIVTADPILLARCIELNLKTGRLGMTPGGRVYLEHEYDLDDALRDLRQIVLNAEPKDGIDRRLARLLKANPPDLMTDAGFVFGVFSSAGGLE